MHDEVESKEAETNAGVRLSTLKRIHCHAKESAGCTLSQRE